MIPINQLNPEEYVYSQATHIEELPIDVLTKIFDFLHLKDFAPLSIINKNFINNIRAVVGQKIWFTRKFKETLHIKF